MRNNLTYETKRLFYDALNIVSYRVGKPGYDTQNAKLLFDAALEKSDCWSPGYKKNIEDWKRTVESLVTGKLFFFPLNFGSDGFFSLIFVNTGTTPTTESLTRVDGRFGTRRPSTNNRPRLPSFNGEDLSELLLLRSLMGSYNGMYDSDEDDDDEDDDMMMFNHSTEKLFVPPTYPYFKFSEERPLLDAIKLKHTNEPTTFHFNFSLSPAQLERLVFF